MQAVKTLKYSPCKLRFHNYIETLLYYFREASSEMATTSKEGSSSTIVELLPQLLPTALKVVNRLQPLHYTDIQYHSSHFCGSHPYTES